MSTFQTQTTQKYYSQKELDNMISDSIWKNAQDALMQIKNNKIKKSKLTENVYV